MDRGARHVVASRGGNRHGVAAHGVPGFLWRISKRAERPELAPEEKLRLPKVSILFPYGSVTRSLSLSLPLCIFLSLTPIATWLLSRSLTSPFITLCLLLYLCSTSAARAMPCLRCFLALLSASKLFLASPFVLLFPFLSRPGHLHLPIYALVYSRSLPSHPPSLIYPFDLSVFLRLTIVYRVVFLSFSASLRNRFLPRATDKPFSVSRCTIHLSGVA